MKNVLIVYNALLEGPAKVHEQSDEIKAALLVLLNPEHEHHIIGIALAIFAAWINPKILENTLSASRDYSPYFLFTRSLKKRGTKSFELPSLPNPSLFNILKSILMFYADLYEDAITLCKSEAHYEASLPYLVFTILHAHRTKSRLELSATSLDFLRETSNQHIVEADLLLGHCYQHGYGVPQNVNLCLSHFKKAALEGSLEAIEELNLIAHNVFSNLPREPMPLFVLESHPTSHEQYPPNACFLIDEKDASFTLMVQTEKTQRRSSVFKAHALSFLSSIKKETHEPPVLLPHELLKLISLYGDEERTYNAWDDLHRAAFQGGMHSQCILAIFHEERLPTLPPLAQAAERELIMTLYQLAADQGLTIAQYRYGLFCLEVCLDFPKAVQYFSLTLEKKPYDHPIDKECQDIIRTRLKSLLLKWFLENIHLISTSVPPHPSVWKMLRIALLIDQNIVDRELLPTWLLFQSMLRLYSNEYHRLYPNDITDRLDDLFAETHELLSATPDFFETLVKNINKTSHHDHRNTEGWMLYFKGYAEWALVDKDRMNITDATLKTLGSAYLLDNAMAAAELAVIHLELIIKTPGVKNASQHLAEAAKWAKFALSINPNLLALRLFDPILCTEQDLSMRLETCSNIFHVRQDSEIINILYCLIQARPYDPVATFTQALLYESKAQVTSDRYYLYKACDYLTEVNKITFPKSLLVETFFRIGQQILQTTDRAVGSEESLHLEHLQRCYSEAALGEHKEALAFMAKHAETGECAFKKDLKKALDYVKKLIKVETDDALISAHRVKAAELQSLIKQEQKALQTQKKQAKASRRKKNHKEVPEKPPVMISGAKLEEVESEEDTAPQPTKARTPTPLDSSPIEEEPVEVVIHRPNPISPPKPPAHTEEAWESLMKTCEEQRKNIQRLIQANHNLQHTLDTREIEHKEAIQRLSKAHTETKRHELHQSEEVIELQRQIRGLKSEILALKEELQAKERRQRFFRSKPTATIETQTLLTDPMSTPVFDKERACYLYDGHPITCEEAIKYNAQMEGFLPTNVIHNMGVCAFLGLGREQDKHFAKRLLEISAGRRLDESRRLLEDCEASISPSHR